MRSSLLPYLLQHSSSKPTCSDKFTANLKTSVRNWSSRTALQLQDQNIRLFHKRCPHYKPNRTWPWRKSAMASSRNHKICWCLPCYSLHPTWASREIMRNIPWTYQDPWVFTWLKVSDESSPSQEKKYWRYKSMQILYITNTIFVFFSTLR